jgi:group I intron endonuclease
VRLIEHISRAGKLSTSYIGNAIAKYGIDVFDVESFEATLSSLNNIEKLLIIWYDSLWPNGYNLISGGNNGKRSAASRRRLSKAAKERYSAGKHHFIGLTQSSATRKKISDGLKRFYKNNPAAWTGRTHTAVAKEKIGAATGTGASSRRACPIVLIHPDGTNEYFGAIVEAAKRYNLDASTLSHVLSGRNKQYKGFVVKRADRMGG